MAIKEKTKEKKVGARLGRLRISPRKVRLVADEIRGLSSEKAILKLQFIPKRSSEPLLKLLKSAVNNAKQAGLQEDKLFVEEIKVNEGNVLKRYMPRARGRATIIRKRTSKVALTLSERS